MALLQLGARTTTLPLLIAMAFLLRPAQALRIVTETCRTKAQR